MIAGPDRHERQIWPPELTTHPIPRFQGSDVGVELANSSGHPAKVDGVSAGSVPKSGSPVISLRSGRFGARVLAVDAGVADAIVPVVLRQPEPRRATTAALVGPRNGRETHVTRKCSPVTRHTLRGRDDNVCSCPSITADAKTLKTSGALTARLPRFAAAAAATRQPVKAAASRSTPTPNARSAPCAGACCATLRSDSKPPVADFVGNHSHDGLRVPLSGRVQGPPNPAGSSALLVAAIDVYMTKLTCRM